MRRRAALAPRYQSCLLRLPRTSPFDREPLEYALTRQDRPGFFWLDSGDAHQRSGAWSFIGWNPSRTIVWRSGRAELLTAEGKESRSSVRPFKLLERELRAQRAQASQAPLPPEGPPFRGGWFAALSYDLGREIEDLPRRAAADLGFPELFLAFHETVLAYDHREGCWWACCLLPGDLPAAQRETEAHKRAQRLFEGEQPAQRRVEPPPDIESAPLPGDGAAVLDSNFTRAQYESAVRRALDYIAAGDIYQVNLSQRFSTAWTEPAFALYALLRSHSPARYGAFVNLGGGQALCSISPELYLSLRAGSVLTRPIKGTRARGRTPDEDARRSDELMHSAKDRAELTMIVDLERNDLGRVCDYGSVRVLCPGELETHPTVFHRVAAISGRLHHRQGLVDLIRATFPGGSVTGAPKIRAMEIIEELEPTRRGPYCGAIGWIGADGDLELNLSIRTAVVNARARTAWYQAGGGIVAESDPAREYEETLAKAAAFFRAVKSRVRPVPLSPQGSTT